MTALKKIADDLSGLRQLAENTPEEIRDTAESLLAEIIFLHGTLETLKERINKEGPVIKTARTTKENPALKSYNTSVMRYGQLFKQLTDLLPEPPKAEADDPLMKFIMDGYKK